MWVHAMTEKRRKDYTFWRRYSEKPGNIPGCPNLMLRKVWKASWEKQSLGLIYHRSGIDNLASSARGEAYRLKGLCLSASVMLVMPKSPNTNTSQEHAGICLQQSCPRGDCLNLFVWPEAAVKLQSDCCTQSVHEVTESSVAPYTFSTCN